MKAFELRNNRFKRPAAEGRTDFALDHLTVVDADPATLVEAAATNGFRSVCLFTESMTVLPRMPHYDLCGSPTAKREVRAMMRQSGIGLDIAYPFTLSRRAEMEDFKRGLDCAAYLGARFANVLTYDRDAERRLEQFASFCALAEEFDLGVVLEFFPGAAVGTLDQGVELVRAIGRPFKVGLNVDLLHLMRSGGSVEQLRSAPPDYILFGQLCDGMFECEGSIRNYEASQQRLLPGQGEFAVKAFLDALPVHCPVSLEVPQESSIKAGLSPKERARMALDAARIALDL
jgi:sugar phosphate isomerase/epimerase